MPRRWPLHLHRKSNRHLSRLEDLAVWSCSGNRSLCSFAMHHSRQSALRSSLNRHADDSRLLHPSRERRSTITMAFLYDRFDLRCNEVHHTVGTSIQSAAYWRALSCRIVPFWHRNKRWKQDYPFIVSDECLQCRSRPSVRLCILLFLIRVLHSWILLTGD